VGRDAPLHGAFLQEFGNKFFSICMARLGALEHAWLTLEYLDTACGYLTHLLASADNAISLLHTPLVHTWPILLI